MRKPIAIAAASATLLAGGTAIAATGGHPLERVFGDRDAELADELAQRLDGVSADEVEKALEDVRGDKQTERRKQQAGALAKHLDGVSAEEAERALEKVEARLFADRPPDPRRRDRGGFSHRFHRVDLVEELAKELGKSESEVRRAFRTAHKERFDAMLDEAVKEGRLTEQQADAMRERFEGRPPRPGPRFHHRGGPGFGPAPEGPPPQIQ